jgi:glycosyltransferase involved in cell wall biosynthesis
MEQIARHLNLFLKTTYIVKEESVVLFSTVHSANDHRIYYKEARSLAKRYPVIILAPMYHAGAVIDVRHVQIPFIGNRLIRFIVNFRHLNAIRRLKPAVLHIHDPELLPLGLICRYFFKAKLVYDVHENQHLDILQKAWLPLALRKTILWVYQKIETFVLKRSAGIVLAEDSYSDVYASYANVETVRNYPILESNSFAERMREALPDLVHLGYVGSVQRIRGILEMLKVVAVIKHTFKKNVILDIVGSFENEPLERDAHQLSRELGIVNEVRFHGGVSHEKALELLRDMDIGLLIYHPLPTHERILPVKLYEYMITGKPIVASDIDLWRTVIGKHHCGIFVDPFDENSAAHAIVSLYEMPDYIRQMGENGYNAIVNEYNWSTQEKNLFSLYRRVLGGEV